MLKEKKMAKRRMINTEVVLSDVFCNLTPSAQALYYQLNMNADDDGIVDKWKNILRYLRIRQEHLDSLIRLGYVIELESGALLISDWLLHNKIRSDRYVEGRHKDELKTVQIHKNGRYFKASEDFLTP